MCSVQFKTPVEVIASNMCSGGEDLTSDLQSAASIYLILL
jgi:hypothetical protein